jgi:hypothetical protein
MKFKRVFLVFACCLFVGCDEWVQTITWTVSHVGPEPYEETVTFSCGYNDAIQSPVGQRPAPFQMGVAVAPNWDYSTVTFSMGTDGHVAARAGGIPTVEGRVGMYCVTNPEYAPDGSFTQAFAATGYAAIVVFYPNNTYSVLLGRHSFGQYQHIFTTTRPMPQ